MHYCSGGCAANAYHATGDVKGIYEYGCELFRKRMECAIMIQVAHDALGLEPISGATAGKDEDCGDCSDCE